MSSEVAHTSNPSTQKVEADGSRSQHGLYSEFQASETLCSKRKDASLGLGLQRAAGYGELQKLLGNVDVSTCGKELLKPNALSRLTHVHWGK